MCVSVSKVSRRHLSSPNNHNAELASSEFSFILSGSCKKFSNSGRPSNFHTSIFRSGELLGKGGFGTVRVVTHKATQIKYALKVGSEGRLVLRLMWKCLAGVPLIPLETPSWDVSIFPFSWRVQPLLNGFGRLREMAKVALHFYLFIETAEKGWL